MITCEEATQLFDAQRQLTRAERAASENHLDHCPTCFQTLLQRVDERLRAMPRDKQEAVAREVEAIAFAQHAQDLRDPEYVRTAYQRKEG